MKKAQGAARRLGLGRDKRRSASGGRLTRPHAKPNDGPARRGERQPPRLPGMDM